MALPAGRRDVHGFGHRELPLGAVPTNYERAFEERPEVFAGWVALNTAIKANMDLRRYELEALAAARRLPRN